MHSRQSKFSLSTFLFSAVLAAGTVFLARRFIHQRKMAKLPKPILNPKTREAARKLQRIWVEGQLDPIDQASWESFPASDAPAW